MFESLFQEIEKAGSLEKFADNYAKPIFFCHGTDKKGNPTYAYVEILPSKAEQFLKDYKARIYLDFEKYGGKVLKKGLGHKPPKKILKEMEEKYDIQHGFEENFRKGLEEMFKGVKGKHTLKNRPTQKPNIKWQKSEDN